MAVPFCSWFLKIKKKKKHHNTQNTQAANVNTFHTKTGLNNLHRRAALLKTVVSRISIVCALQV